MVETTMEARPLTSADIAEAERLAHRFGLLDFPLVTRLDSWMLGENFMVYPARGAITALCGGPSSLFITAGATLAAGRAFGLAYAASRGVRSVTGPSLAVRAAWQPFVETLGPGTWRDEYAMATSTRAPSSLTRLAGLRQADVTEIPSLMPAAISVFTDTNGVSPERWGVGEAFRRNMEGLARRGRAFAAFGADGPEFKAEVNIVRGGVCQVKGVWVRPDLRGQGIGVAGMAALLDMVVGQVADTVTLRVDGANQRARNVYELTGFRSVGKARSVLVPP